MLRALTTAATGMIAQQNYLDVIANNVANVNTTGFKKSRIEFQDLLSQAVRTPGALMNQGTYQPVGTEIGLGVKTAATTRVFTQGIAISTGRQLDIEIEGEGFLQVMKEDGSLAYTRDGCLQVDSLGQLCTNDSLCSNYSSCSVHNIYINYKRFKYVKLHILNKLIRVL